MPYRLVELMARGARASTHLGTLPVLLLYGGNDQIIPHVATEVFSSLLGQNATVKFYPDGFHMLLRDHAGAARATDIAEWIDAISRDHPPVRLDTPSEHKAESNDQDGAENNNAAVTEAVSAAAETSTKTADPLFRIQNYP